jgi:hypothetical protein
MGEMPDLALMIERSLWEIASAVNVIDGVRVTTHCMYPSNGLVSVMVRGGAKRVVVSDEGAAIGEALCAGIPIKDYNRTLSYLVKYQGLSIKDGVIFTSRVPIAAAPIAILHVANASQEVARWLYDHMNIKRSRNFRVMLASFLKKRFEMIGFSPSFNDLS